MVNKIKMIRRLLNVVHLQVHKNIDKESVRSLKGFIGWGKSQILVRNRVRVSGSVLHIPTQFFWKYPPGIFFVFGSEMEGHCARRSLPPPWKLGIRIVAWWKPCMFCKESLGKIKFRAFRKRVGPRILLLESIDYFGASEHYWVVKKEEESELAKLWWSGVVNFHCMQMSLGISMQFIFGHDWKDVPCKSLFRYLAMMLFLWNRGLWIFMYLYTRIACVCRCISNRR